MSVTSVPDMTPPPSARPHGQGRIRERALRLPWPVARRSRAPRSGPSAPGGGAGAALETLPAAPALFVVVVDDELLARRRLRRYLAEEAGISRVAECASARAAAAIMEAERPDVVFADAGLPGLAGLGEMAGAGAGAPVVVLVTAGARRLLERGEFHGTDHLTKPVARKPLRAILDHVRRRVAPPGAARGDGRLPHAVPGRLVIRSGGRILALPLEAVDWIEAADNYVRVHKGDRMHVVRGTLTDFEVRLCARRFVRIHRHAVVNVDAVEEVHSVRGAWRLHLRSGAMVSVGRLHRGAVRQLLGR